MKKLKLFMVIAILSLTANDLFATDTIASGTAGENLDWVITDDSVMTISGIGEIPAYSNGGSPWNTYRWFVKTIIIDEGVTSIGNYAFSNFLSLTSAIIPNSVVSIGYGAFYYCPELLSVNIPNSVKSMGNSVFYKCGNLISVILSDSITSIGNNAFGECANLVSINFPIELVSIGDAAFELCSKLPSVIIPNKVTSIGNSAFNECDSLNYIVIPVSVNEIKNYAFAHCSNIDTVKVFWQSPISISNVFSGSNVSSINLVVPCSAVSAYEDSYNWQDFNILCYGDGAVSDERIMYNKSESTLQVYPNPISNELTLQPTTAGATINIYNSVGLRIATYKADAEQTSLNLQNLPAGIYFVKVDGKTAKIVKR